MDYVTYRIQQEYLQAMESLFIAYGGNVPKQEIIDLNKKFPVVQRIERQPSKLNVSGLNPLGKQKINNEKINLFIRFQLST